MVLRRTNPLTPNVEGKMYAMACHGPGMLVCGHDMPERNKSGTEVKTMMSMTFSR